MADGGGGVSTPAEKIAAAALKWAAAEVAKKAAKKAFADAWGACFINKEGSLYSDPESLPMFQRETGPSDSGYGYVVYWIYSKHVAEDLRGDECESDPLWIAQNRAWSALKEATAKAGAARGALTRMCNRELAA